MNKYYIHKENKYYILSEWWDYGNRKGCRTIIADEHIQPIIDYVERMLIGVTIHWYLNER